MLGLVGQSQVLVKGRFLHRDVATIFRGLHVDVDVQVLYLGRQLGWVVSVVGSLAFEPRGTRRLNGILTLR